MAGKDIYNRVNEVVQLHPAAITATKTATDGADLRGYESALVICQVGAIGAGEAISFQVQDSDTGGTVSGNYAAVAAAQLLGGGTIDALSGTIDANQVISRGYIGTKRYVRVAVTALTGTVECAAVIVRGDARFPRTR
jgi:hypothetical protein